MSDALRDYYSARAAEYDQVYQKPERQADLRAIETWLPPLLEGRRVLEIACGTGYWTRFLAPEAESVVAIDAAAGPLEIARRRLSADNVTFRPGDAYRLSAESGSFNGAFAGFWLSHVPRQQMRDFLRQLALRLEPGSPVVLLDNRYVEGSSTPISERDLEGNTYQVRPLANGSRHRVLKNFPTESELRLLAAAVSPHCDYHEWPHYWGLRFVTANR